MLCLYCGAKNADLAQSCVSCKRDISTPPDVKGHLGQVISACEKLQKGIISLIEFEEVLRRVDDITQQAKDEISSTPRKDAKAAEFPRRQALRGLEMFEEAISELKLYLQDKDTTHIEYAIPRIREAFKISVSAHKEFDELVKAEKKGGSTLDIEA